MLNYLTLETEVLASQLELYTFCADYCHALCRS